MTPRGDEYKMKLTGGIHLGNNNIIIRLITMLHTGVILSIDDGDDDADVVILYLRSSMNLSCNLATIFVTIKLECLAIIG